MHFTAPPKSTVRLRSAPLPGPGAGGEHDRVGAAEVRAQVVVLEVAQHRDGAVGLEVGGVVGVADQAAGGVAGAASSLQEATGDLSVASGDEDIHGLRGYSRCMACGTCCYHRDSERPGQRARRRCRPGGAGPAEQRAAGAPGDRCEHVAVRRRAAGGAPIELRPRSAAATGCWCSTGLLLRRVGVGGRHAAELLGPGDLLRPWQHDGGDVDARRRVDWRVVAPTRVAVLDPRWTAAPRPGRSSAPSSRAARSPRSLRLVIAMAIAQQPKLDVRLWMLFWELADRYGKVHPDGIHLDLPLTHEVLSHLAGARRPSVSGALTRLADDGRPAPLRPHTGCSPASAPCSIQRSERRQVKPPHPAVLTPLQLRQRLLERGHQVRHRLRLRSRSSRAP